MPPRPGLGSKALNEELGRQVEMALYRVHTVASPMVLGSVLCWEPARIPWGLSSVELKDFL